MAAGVAEALLFKERNDLVTGNRVGASISTATSGLVHSVVVGFNQAVLILLSPARLDRSWPAFWGVDFGTLSFWDPWKHASIVAKPLQSSGRLLPRWGRFDATCESYGADFFGNLFSACLINVEALTENAEAKSESVRKVALLVPLSSCLI